MHVTSSQRIFITFLLASSVLGGFYIYYSNYRSSCRIREQEGEQSSRTVAELLRGSNNWVNRTRNPVARKCQMYQEFRYLDFLHPALRHRLCTSAEAYKRYPDGYPMCRIQNPFNEDMLNVVRQNSDAMRLDCLNNVSVQLFGHKGNDLLSQHVKEHHVWEKDLVHWTLKFALKVPQVTFLDMGSNIGVYSIQAAKLGLPVVSLDANIRNLLRLRLTLNAASLDADLVWNFISPDQTLNYLSLLENCNFGGAGKELADLADTVPVMPLSSERISSLVKTKNIVMKMDIQGAELTFLQMSGRLFTDFKVAAVQFEWYPPYLNADRIKEILTFFSSRGYSVWKLPDFKPLDPNKATSWQFIDIIFVHKDFFHLL